MLRLLSLVKEGRSWEGSVVVVGGSSSLSSHFLALLFLICLRERERHFYKQQASIFQYGHDGSLVLIVGGILLRDVGLSQVAAYTAIPLWCCYTQIYFRATSLRRLKMECALTQNTQYAPFLWHFIMHMLHIHWPLVEAMSSNDEQLPQRTYSHAGMLQRSSS